MRQNFTVNLLCVHELKGSEIEWPCLPVLCGEKHNTYNKDLQAMSYRDDGGFFTSNLIPVERSGGDRMESIEVEIKLFRI